MSMEHFINDHANNLGLGDDFEVDFNHCGNTECDCTGEVEAELDKQAAARMRSVLAFYGSLTPTDRDVVAGISLGKFNAVTRDGVRYSEHFDKVVVPKWLRYIDTGFGKVQVANGELVEVTEEDYMEALEVLPPIYIRDATWFAVSEIYTHNRDGHPVYYCFGRINGKYYGVLGTLPDAKARFLAEQYKASPVLAGALEVAR
jgi:hypothetical protein